MGETGEDSQRVQTSSNKMSKFCESTAQHGDYS